MNICAWRAFNLLGEQCFDQIEKKITDLKNTFQNYKLLKKLLSYRPQNMLLKIELEKQR